MLNRHGGDIGIGAVRGGTRFGTADATGGDGNYFSGDIAEIVHFNERNTNTFQRKLLATYYEGKYGIAVGAEDLYPDANDVTHPHDIFGIGRDDANNRHSVGPKFRSTASIG